MLWIVADKYNDDVYLYKNKPTVTLSNPDKPYDPEFEEFCSIDVDSAPEYEFCLSAFTRVTGIKLAHGKPMKLKIEAIVPGNGK